MLVLSASAIADTTDEIIALTKAQWAAQIAEAPAAVAMKDIADDYTEFNDVFPALLDGKPLNMRFAEAYAKDSVKVVAAEMSNPKVQVYGDVAILTYNYSGLTQGADGAISGYALKSTRVYARRGGRWMLVHANFAPHAN